MLSEKMKEKMRKQKAVGHNVGSVVPHEVMEQWITEAEKLEAKAGQESEELLSDADWDEITRGRESE